MLWTSLFPPWFLEKCAEHPILVKAIAQVLDSMVTAKLEIKAIEDRYIRRIKETEELEDKSLKWSEGTMYKFEPVKRLQRPCFFFGPGPCPGSGELGFSEKAMEEKFYQQCNDCQGFVGYHDEHSCTCHKAPNGLRSCRMGMPQCPNNYGTRCIEIEVTAKQEVVNEKEITITEVAEVQNSAHKEIPVLKKMCWNDIGSSPIRPFPNADGRMLLWSLARPSIYFDKDNDKACYLSEKQIQEGVKYGSITEVDMKDRQVEFNDPDRYKILFDGNINGYVVPFNDLLTYLDGSNTAIYPLGSTEAAKVKVYYMTKYIIKDQGAFKKLLSIASTAYNLTIDHPNTHVDTCKDPISNNEVVLDGLSDKETAVPSINVEYNSIKRFGNTLLNTMRTTYERSSQESASKILGYPASYSSIKTWLIFMKSAIDQAKLASFRALEGEVDGLWPLWDTDIDNEAEDCSDDDSSIDEGSIAIEGQDEEFDDCVYSDDENERLNDTYGDDSKRPEYLEIIHDSPSSTPTLVSGQQFKTTNQFESYRFRSVEARHLSLYEYCGIFYLEPFSKDEKMKEGLGIPGNYKHSEKRKHNSRPENKWNILHENHPMRYTHKEKLRSKHILPVISKRTPRLLYDLPRGDSSMKNEAAVFYLSLFCPVDPITGLFIAVWSCDDKTTAQIKSPFPLWREYFWKKNKTQKP